MIVPILFSGPMVRAILDDRKTITRRVIDLKQIAEQTGCTRGQLAWSTLLGGWAVFDGNGAADLCEVKAPYAVGDVLWVRETWRVGAWSHAVNGIAVDYKADGFARCEWLHPDEADFLRYAEQSMRDAKTAGLVPNDDGQFVWPVGASPTRWRPSIHMPKWACRLFLRVTDVRVELLQDISEADAVAEGIGSTYTRECAVPQFARLWDSLAQDGVRWEDNPWIWRLTFDRCEAPAGWPNA
ncbi:hypothetical protein JCM16814_08070 [Desulfobaculum senezii]